MCLHVMMKLAQGGGREMIKIMFDAIVVLLLYLVGLYRVRRVRTPRKPPTVWLFGTISSQNVWKNRFEAFNVRSFSFDVLSIFFLLLFISFSF